LTGLRGQRVLNEGLMGWVEGGKRVPTVNRCRVA
jgi:hypothetical protein